MKRNIKGFTLVELIIVFVILAILAGVAIPSLITYIDNSDERECAAAIKSLEAAAQAERKITPTLTASIKMNPSSLFTVMENGTKRQTESCPSGGVYSAKYDDATDRIVITCSVHGEPSVAGYKAVIDDLYNKYKDDHHTLYVSGGTLNQLIKDEYGGEFPTTDVDGIAYFIKGNTPPGFSGPIMYLSTNSGVSDWKGFYFYVPTTDEETGEVEWKWYVSTKVHPYTKKPEGVYLTSLNQFNSLLESGSIVETDKVS